MPMTRRIEPFAGLLYDPERAGVLSNLVAPPYDLIDRARQDALYARSLYNVVRLELNRDPDRYASASRTLGEWLSEGMLKRAARPAIYLYSQFFEIEGRLLRRDGLIVRIRLEEFSAGRILPHERTFPAAKQDRLELLTALNTNVSSVFGLYAGKHPALAGSWPSLRRTSLCWKSPTTSASATNCAWSKTKPQSRQFRTNSKARASSSPMDTIATKPRSNIAGAGAPPSTIRRCAAL